MARCFLRDDVSDANCKKAIIGLYQASTRNDFFSSPRSPHRQRKRHQEFCRQNCDFISRGDAEKAPKPQFLYILQANSGRAAQDDLRRTNAPNVTMFP